MTVKGKCLIAFVAGTIVGGIVASFVTKHTERKKFTEEATEMVNGLREQFTKTLKKKDENIEDADDISETVSEPTSETKVKENKKEVTPEMKRAQYAKLINNYREANDQPHLINSDTYGTDNYRMAMLYMYEDGVITHEHDDFPLEPEDKERLLGDVLTRVDGEYEDRFYVRCPEKETDYEVVMVDKEFY